jgi:hypothetical protein
MVVEAGGYGGGLWRLVAGGLLGVVWILEVVVEAGTFTYLSNRT